MGDFIKTEINTVNFSVIYCINVIYFWDDLQKPFEKVRSLLRDEGIFCFYMARNEDLTKVRFTRNDIFNKYSIEQITDALKSAGFSEADYNYKHGYFIKAKK